MGLLDDDLDRQRNEQDSAGGPDWLPLSPEAHAHKADLPGVVGLIAAPFAIFGWVYSLFGRP
jgi:hypothetical protein